ncbi:MAG TPA: trans-aconitate methyltransferase [Pseudomonas sp.]|nr:trans-aconitate methyltransferase [Pseudomonas sp.]
MLAGLRRRLPVLVALFAQVIAVVIVWLLLYTLALAFGLRLGGIPAALLQGAVAAAVGQCLGLSKWWLPINLGFVPGLLLVQEQALPPSLLLAGFGLLLALNWNAIGERVPLYLTGRAAEQRLLQHLEQRPAGFTFIDLGCGLGGTLARLARACPEGCFVGVETAPLSFLLAWLRCLPRRNCRVRLRSLWREDLGRYDVVYCFLSPAPMPALWDKARREMRRDAQLISNSFAVPGKTPEEQWPIDDWRQSSLLLYRPAAHPPDGPRATG